ncbi:hypothetical protein M426DRAFT_28101 [Hypoxylon sp. CI-4A]|nr:hypothetical protein M426DRAFT_28101 [Hypoxylon sp. CI-4A]
MRLVSYPIPSCSVLLTHEEQFLPLRDFDVITSALTFSAAECRVRGSCDLYTTKAAGSDKKLYRSIENTLESQHAALVKLGASLSPPQRKEMAASLNLSRSSPFGNLSEVSSRRTYAYLIATLNASHPDYDFSNVLRPTDFRRVRDLPHLMADFDATMAMARPPSNSLLPPNTNTAYRSFSHSPVVEVDEISTPVWSPHMWTMIDKEMTLQNCSVYSYEPLEDPFDGDESAIWRMHYLFFNKRKKRVAYLFVRGLPTLVNSPALAPNRRASNGLSKRHADPLPGSFGANKRAKFWLGDQLATRVVGDDDDDEYYDDEEMIYNPDDDVDFDPLNYASDSDEEESYAYDDENEDSEDEEVAHSVRGMSEDIAAQMEI